MKLHPQQLARVAALDEVRRGESIADAASRHGYAFNGLRTVVANVGGGAVIRGFRSRDALARAIYPKMNRVGRTCMCCERKFMSAGIHNRLCDQCRGRDGPPR